MPAFYKKSSERLFITSSISARELSNALSPNAPPNPADGTAETPPNEPPVKKLKQ